MGTVRDYQDSIKFEQFDDPEWQKPKSLSRRTQRLKETPTRVGLVIIGTSLFLITSLLTILYFALQLYQIPKYDNIVDARLGDHYQYRLSSPYPGTLGIPEMQNTAKS